MTQIDSTNIDEITFNSDKEVANILAAIDREAQANMPDTQTLFT